MVINFWFFPRWGFYKWDYFFLIISYFFFLIYNLTKNKKNI